MRRRWFWTGVATCLAAMALLKYLSIRSQGGAGASSLVVTVGVSYFTFQAISYLADVYLETEEAQTDLGRYALYLAFFPKLLQGPIERACDLMPQLKQEYRFDYAAARSALLLFAKGFFKKVVIADRLALHVDQVYGNLHDYRGLVLLVTAYAYALQIYFDFSGYTDMARGTGRIFGIELTENFNAPYAATSIADFWRRWHISFSRWILDYIFKPLQMAWRGAGQAGTALALLVTFLVSGVWHGAAWSFVAWGGLHGIFLACSTIYRPYQKKLHKALGIGHSGWYRLWRVFVTFNLVTVAWVFFRAESVADALYLLRNIADLSAIRGALSGGARAALGNLLLVGMSPGQFLILVLSLAALGVAESSGAVTLEEKPAWARMALYSGIAVAIVMLKVQNPEFIYFKF